jgi:hypothetical protein
VCVYLAEISNPLSTNKKVNHYQLPDIHSQAARSTHAALQQTVRQEPARSRQERPTDDCGVRGQLRQDCHIVLRACCGPVGVERSALHGPTAYWLFITSSVLGNVPQSLDNRVRKSNPFHGNGNFSQVTPKKLCSSFHVI